MLFLEPIQGIPREVNRDAIDGPVVQRRVLLVEIEQRELPLLIGIGA